MQSVLFYTLFARFSILCFLFQQPVPKFYHESILSFLYSSACFQFFIVFCFVSFSAIYSFTSKRGAHLARLSMLLFRSNRSTYISFIGDARSFFITLFASHLPIPLVYFYFILLWRFVLPFYCWLFAQFA